MRHYLSALNTSAALVNNMKRFFAWFSMAISIGSLMVAVARASRESSLIESVVQLGSLLYISVIATRRLARSEGSP